MSLASVFMRDEWVAAAKEDDFIVLQPLDAVFWIPAGGSFWFESPPLKGWAAGQMVFRHEMFFEKEIL